jgi:UDP-2,3-diacylglucosamine pyrophosphatase LpxH
MPSLPLVSGETPAPFSATVPSVAACASPSGSRATSAIPDAVPEAIPNESLLVFSDVHLGSDLNDCSENVTKRSTSIDRDLVAFLAHYRQAKPQGDRWRFVIAGDFIDFIGMSIAVPSTRPGELSTEATEEERLHGLGNAPDHALAKMRRVGARHADVFAELARVVADGHALTIVHGNHDIELYWDAVRDELRTILLSHARAYDASLDAAAFQARIEFSPWFFYRDGLAYIEHGHQYDAFCSTEHVMAPLSPLDPRRMARGFTDVLLRYVVRPTLGMKEHGHEHAGLVDYVAFAARLGARGLVRLAGRFVSAVTELFRLRRQHFAEAAALLRAEHERRVALLAEATRISGDRLRALLKLQVPPITRSVRGILASVLLDRLGVAVLSLGLLAVLGVIGIRHGHALYAAVGVLPAWALFHRYLSGQRNVDAADLLVAKASQLVKLFPAAFVVMGHTHVPVQVPAGESTYINVGSWSEEEATDAAGSPRAPRTHLVIHPSGPRGEARLLSWDPSSGPRNYTWNEEERGLRSTG